MIYTSLVKSITYSLESEEYHLQNVTKQRVQKDKDMHNILLDMLAIYITCLAVLAMYCGCTLLPEPGREHFYA